MAEIFDSEGADFDVIVLIITRSCMLSCSYCYVKKEGAHMDPRVFSKSLDLILKIKKKNKRITILFFGGEPLMRFDLVRESILRLNKLDPENMNHYDFCLFTNGILLDRIDLNFLKEFNVRLMISIDGERRNHDMNRGKRGLDSYGTILKMMPKIKKLGISCTSFTTFTPSSVESLYRSYLHFKKMGFDLIEMYPALYRTNSEKEWNQKILGELEIQIGKIADSYFKDLAEDKTSAELCSLMLYRKQIKNKLDEIELDQREICVDLDGNMYIGNEFLSLNENDRENIKIGNVLKAHDLDGYYDKYIHNKGKFRSQILKNPTIAHYYRDPALKAMKVFYKVMGKLDKRIMKLEKENERRASGKNL